MPFHIKNPETDALARKFAGIKKLGLTEAVHLALEEALVREATKPSLPELAAGFYRELKARSAAAKAVQAAKAKIDLAAATAEAAG